MAALFLCSVSGTGSLGSSFSLIPYIQSGIRSHSVLFLRSPSICSFLYHAICCYISSNPHSNSTLICSVWIMKSITWSLTTVSIYTGLCLWLVHLFPPSPLGYLKCQLSFMFSGKSPSILFTSSFALVHFFAVLPKHIMFKSLISRTYTP